MLHRIGLATLATVSLLLAGATGFAQNAPATPPPIPEPPPFGAGRVCLVTFNNEAAVEAAVNTNVLRAQLLLPQAAVAQASSQERVVDFGEETIAKCNCLNDPATRATC